MHRKQYFSRFDLAAGLLVPFTIALAGAAATEPGEKIKITRLDDLPQHVYPITGKVSELVKSSDAIKGLAAKVRADIEADLAKFEIDDATTLQRWYGTLLAVDIINDDDDSALARIEQIRSLEDKEANRLTTGLTTQAAVAARRALGRPTSADDPEYRKAFREQFAKLVHKLPWDTVQDVIEQNKGRAEIFSEPLIMGIIEARMEPTVAKTGELSADEAGGLLGMYVAMKERLPVKVEVIAVYQEMIDAHKTVKLDIWAERAVSFTADRKLTPVLVAAWDSGTDTEVFKDRLFLNPNEKMNGTDYDGNGFVDDVHGIAYDIHAERTTGMLCPLGDAAERMPQVMKHMKGFMDVQAAIDSPEASALKKHLGGLAPSDVQGFLEDLSLAGNYAHGTHVAGIMTDGNPAAKLMVARLSYDHRMTPVARTIEWGQRDGAKCRDTIGYFKQHGVRVVNMSWGEAQKDAEESLERNGIGGSAEERREIARKVFALQKEGLYEAIKGAPEVLFVAAAGNADNDVEFDDDIPSSFDLPNLLIVGAVDQAGDPTTFTSFGKTVQVYANGFEVESYVPGGERMKMSGTSMASPNAANLAAKLLAVNPKLTPPEVIDLIKKGADKKSVGDTTFLLLNPKKTIDLL